jgi:hypothetical protein
MKDFNCFLTWSLIAHIIMIVIGSIFSTSKKNDFVVFGAHSRYASHTQYKSSRLVPFSNKRVGAPGKAGNKRGKSSGKNKQKGKVSKHKRFKQQKTLPKKPGKSVQKQSDKNKRPTRSKQKVKNAVKERVPELDDAPPAKKSAGKSKQKKQKPTPPPEPEADDEIEAVEPIIEKESDKHKASTETKAIEQPEPPSIGQEEESSSEEIEATTSNNNESSNDGYEDDNSEGFSIDGVDDPTEVAHYQRFVQEEIDRVWRPPLGVKKGTVCTIAFMVNEKGIVQTCTMIKRSSVLIYDLSIMRIARELRFHASLWGKQFKIDFCQ